MMVLRPAEIAVIILTFSEYSIKPLHKVIGLEAMSETDKTHIIKLVALLALGETSSVKYSHMVSINYLFRRNNIHQPSQCQTVREDQQYIRGLQSSRLLDRYLWRNL